MLLVRKGKQPTWLVYGDSHADALASAFSDTLEAQGNAAYFVFESGCLPVNNGSCGRFNAEVSDFAKRHPEIRTTVLVTPCQPLERGYIDEAGRPQNGEAAIKSFSANLDRTIAERTAGGRNLIVWLPVPGARRPVPGALARNMQFGRDWDIRYTRAEYDKQFAFLFEALARHPNVSVIRSAPYVCPLSYCEVLRNGRPLYHDDAHPAASASVYSGQTQN